MEVQATLKLVRQICQLQIKLALSTIVQKDSNTYL